MTPSEIYAINLQNKEPKYYARIPHILDHLTYDEIDPQTGKSEVKRLSVYAIQLYRILKSIAGDYGACWQNRDKLADLANMSAGAVSNAKKELQNRFHQLDLNPLIEITKKKRKFESGISEYDCITIIDIWSWNNAFNSIKGFLNKEAPSPGDTDGVAPSPGDDPPLGAPSPGDTNNNIVKKNPLFKEQQQAVCSVVGCSLDNESPVPSEASKDLEVRTKAFNWFMKIGCDERSALNFVDTFTADDIKNASIYVEKQLAKKREKNENIPNIIGYLRRTLENKWWLPQKR